MKVRQLSLLIFIDIYLYLHIYIYMCVSSTEEQGEQASLRRSERVFVGDKPGFARLFSHSDHVTNLVRLLYQMRG